MCNFEIHETFASVDGETITVTLGKDGLTIRKGLEFIEIDHGNFSTIALLQRQCVAAIDAINNVDEAA